MRPFALASLVGLAGLIACQPKQRAAHTPPRLDAYRPPGVELPELKAPSPLPAARVLHLLFSANVVGELEPCG